MPKSMDFIKFKKWLKQYNLRILEVTKHSSAVLDSDGKIIMRFPVTHQKNSKDIVQACYTTALDKKLIELGLKRS